MPRQLVVATVLVALLSVGSAPLPENEYDSLYDGELGYVTDFRFTDQQGRTVTPEDLRGKVWVVSFFFSTCTECSKYQHNMTALQEQLAGWPDVQLVSLSIDPEKDTPEQLANFARNYGADPARWRLLTGPKDEVDSLITSTFKQSVGVNSNPEPGAEFLHSFKFMVVDHRGKIRGYVDGREPQEVERLGERVKKLVQAKYLPTVNASLNGLAGLLLIAGYVAVRKRQIATHQVFMWSALAVSALFLCCYLYYHFLVLQGQPTRFSGEGWVRPVYFGILLSHTVLAAVVAPLALVTAYLGVRDRVARHRAVARWTLPLWLYVSVTGVVVYVMLYHLYAPA